MATYSLGDVVTVSTTVTVAGVPTDPTSISLTVQNPDGTTTNYTPVHDGTGLYHYSYAPAAAGHYIYRFVATGTGAMSDEGTYDVTPAFSPGILALTDVKTHLNIAASDTTQDDELHGFINAATEVIEDLVGPVTRKTYTEYFDGGVGQVMLSHRPVLSVTSGSEVSGTTTFTLTEQPFDGVQNGYGFTVDYSTGQVTRRVIGGDAGTFPDGAKNVWFTYVAGRSALPASVRLAALELIRHLWQQGQQGTRPVFGAGSDEGYSASSAYAVPNRVLELLKPHRRTPGVG